MSSAQRRIVYSSPHTSKWIRCLGLIRNKFSSFLYLFAFFLIFLCFTLDSWAATKSIPQNNGAHILILNSYHTGYIWSDDEQQGAIAVFQAAGVSNDIYIEYLDSKHHTGNAYLQNFKNLLHSKYSNKKIDIVMVMDNPALDFLLRNRQELFGAVPVVFCGINDYKPSMHRGQTDMTGIAQSIDPAGTIDVMLKLHPKTRKILVINDYTVTGASFRSEVESIAPRFSGRVKIRYNGNVSFSELLDEVKALPDDTLILFQSFVTDRTGRVFDWRHITQIIAAQASVPMYGVHLERLGLGIVGGKLLDGRKHGADAAAMGLRILAGEKASSIPVVTMSDAHYMFDARALTRFKIDMSALPPESTVINRPVSFFAANKKIIIIGSQIIFVLCVVIVLLVINIGQRRRAAIALQKSEKQFRLLANNAPDAIFIQTREQFAYVNAAFCGLIGAPSPEDILGRSVYDLFHPDLHEKIRERIHLLNVERQRVPTMEQKFLKMDGTWVDVEVAAVPFNYHGENGALVFVRDISGRKRAEKDLRASEERFRSIIENTEAGYFMVDVSGNIVDVNLAWAKMYGYQRREDVIGANYLSLKQEGDIERTKVIFQGILKDEKQFLSGLLSRKMKDGRIGYHTYSAKAVKWEGKVIGIEGFIIDATERKLMEAELSEEKERLLVTLRSIGDGVITTDIDGRIVMMNKVAEELTGWSLNDAAGLPMSDVFYIINETTRQRHENPVDKVLATGAIVTLANNTLLIAKDKTERIVADSAAPIRDRNDHVLGVVLVFRDTTGKKRMEDAVRNAEKLEAIGILAGGIAHDFNNLLSGIYGYLEMVKRDADRGDINHVSSCVAKALATYERARHITQQLLTFSKGGAPIRRLQHLDRLVRESVTFVLAGSGVTPVFNIPEGQWLCSCDETQISQVIDNITINARDAMHEGGRVDVSLSRLSADEAPTELLPANYFLISIRDHGAGIAKEHMPNIFDPFFTTRQHGSGLGLATSYSIIKKHNGHIAAESTVGEGSIFSIYLPQAQEVQKPVAGMPERKSLHKGNGSILIMDDEDVILEVVSAMLKAKGYRPITVSNGDEAIALVREASFNNHYFSAAILDLTIPGGRGGKETVRELLKIDDDLKVIAASGYSNDPVMVAPGDFGFAAKLAKPFRLAEVEAVLKELLT